jgi:hypothetical protein
MKNAMQTATHRQGYWNVFLISTLFVFLAGCGGGGSSAGGAAPAKFSLATAPASLTVGQGQEALVEVTIMRDAGFTEPVRVTLSQPPAGIADDTLVLSGSLNRGLLPIRVSADLAAGSVHRLDVMGTAAGAASQIATSNLTVSAPQAYAQNLIAAALDAGTLDYATSLLYRAYALFGDNRLPDLYFGAGSLEEDNGLFDEIRQRFASLPVAAQNQLQPFIVRPADPRSVRNSATPAAHAQANKTSGFRPAFSAPSPATCLSATAAGSWISKRSASHPVRVWAQCRGEPTTDADSVTLIDKTLVVLNKVYAPMTGVMGQPLFDLEGDDNAIDFYIVDDGGYVYRRAENFKPNGLGSTYNDDAEAPVGRGNSAFVTLPRSLLYTGRFHNTVIHEFFHVLQKAHNAEFAHKTVAGKPNEYERHWFVEASATWASAHFDRTLAPWDGGRGAYLDAHRRFKEHFLPSFEALNTSGSPHDYSAYIWPYFVEQETGGTGFMTNIWAGLEAVTTFEAADNVIGQAYPFATNFKRFAMRNVNTELMPGDPLPRSQRHVNLDPDQFADDGKEPPYLTGTLVANQEYSQALQLKNLSVRYVRLTVADTNPAVRKVVVDTSGLQPSSDLDVQALVLTDDGWVAQPIDIMLGREQFCFDKGPTTASVRGSFREILLVVSNHATPKGTDVSGTLRVQPSSLPCATIWEGTINEVYRLVVTGPITTTTTITNSANVTFEFDDAALVIRDEVPFRLRSGSYTYESLITITGRNPECRTIATSAGTIPPGPFQPLTSSGTSAFLITNPTTSQFNGGGNSYVSVTETSNCNDSNVDVTTNYVYLVPWWYLSGFGAISADGNSIRHTGTTPDGSTYDYQLNRRLE